MGRKRTYIGIGFSVFGVVTGASAFIVWNSAYQQPWTGAMGGLSGERTLAAVRWWKGRLEGNTQEALHGLFVSCRTRIRFVTQTKLYYFIKLY